MEKAKAYYMQMQMQCRDTFDELTGMTSVIH